MRLALYWSYSTRSLVRGGQRTILAIFCVAVGVMARGALALEDPLARREVAGSPVGHGQTPLPATHRRKRRRNTKQSSSNHTRSLMRIAAEKGGR